MNTPNSLLIGKATNTAPNPNTKSVVLSFGPNSSILTPSQLALLRAAGIKTGSNIKISGYAFPYNTKAVQKAISLDRAVTVRNLLSKEMKPTILVVTGAGSTPNKLCAKYLKPLCSRGDHEVVSLRGVSLFRWPTRNRNSTSISVVSMREI